ncbi:hypothetical protein [Brevundimonas sp.]|jgi:hypothetical protein|uniref:hypothetical protein n=1 Tax=Brevundimonas sp. TaxID=1871086 RepID=UPI0037837A69
MNGKNIDFNKVGDLVYNFAEGLLTDLQKNLDKPQGKFNSPINASGNLRQSINFEPLKITQFGISFQLVLDDYYIWVDKGRKPGHRPPIDAILKWISAKPLKLKSSVDLTRINKKGVQVKRRATTEERMSIDEERRRAAELIADKIEKKGTTATNFYSDVVTEKRFIAFAKELSEAFKQDIIISLK